MKVALTVWENRISPLFDATRMLLIADIGRRGITGSRLVPIDCDSPFSRAARLDTLGVDVLICGGISEFFARLIEARHIEIIPFASGTVDEILDAYVEGNIFNKRFRMPGCGGQKDACGGDED
ncbi:MAG: NifB/NifX family molybdenum-iron cluster-binding protein [Deltaproteobacteria bacterium]|nr:NifB/NifX family molybdenum-iron cluster-binding protein [Deltaproteobacteria bacterium]